ncbi:NAD(P)H-dependent oxidoreductase [Pectobacterium carotovorum]|uniref:NAD(P)H-dependent oxidoreductase n=1 Tax=Pectobacterium carotovorum TaxID=554 RepID=UPI0015DFC788|nr:NAD(P)H-dependent oxidoreductase [Pectobacterium carotovorum]MBA0182066.1 NAD(P)H-dependent oxidoreductase [Pectobacterium carotovorum]MBA0194838.1 NAD(P)H-dependent oxidoreductase [Pectobacterium carotovorum]MBA0202630.1 NAD(P)H-dependent oxidoreductase [Pectobacterium carotovorum]
MCNFQSDDSKAGNVVEKGRRKLIKSGVIVAAVALILGFMGTAVAASTNTTHNVLVINAHQKYPGISEGKLNNTLTALIKDEMKKKGYEVRETNIEQGYNVDEEVQKHLWADIVITQSPMFWFGAPWIYKKYVDEVFTAGMMQQSFISGDGRTTDDPSKQYGTGGKLQGKKFMLSLTMNTPKEAFNDKNQKLHAGRTLEDLFSSTTSVYKFCGFEILPIFASFDVIRNPQISHDIDNLKKQLADL